jgi:putative endonuclease
VRPGDPARGLEARRSGRAGEWVAAALLMLKGYQILGFRLRTPQGEIDLLAKRGRILAVVEVKRRADLNQALEALDFAQKERLLRAGLSLMARRPALRQLDLRIDLIALAPKSIPRHVRNIADMTGRQLG